VTVHESKASALPRLARMCSDCLPGLERLEFLVVPAKRKAYVGSCDLARDSFSLH